MKEKILRTARLNQRIRPDLLEAAQKSADKKGQTLATWVERLFKKELKFKK